MFGPGVMTASTTGVAGRRAARLLETSAEPTARDVNIMIGIRMRKADANEKEPQVRPSNGVETSREEQS